MEDSLFDKILNGDISLTVHGQEPETNTQAQGRPSSDISEKAIGGRLGRRGGLGGLIGGGLLRPPAGMVFVDITGAIDGDEDGIVFEGTPFKRPIIPRAVVPKNIGLTQQDGALAEAMKREEKRRGDSKPKRRRMSDRDVVDLYEQREGRGQSRAMTAGSRSRTDRYPVVGRDVDLESLFDDLEMSEDEKRIAHRQLRNDLEDINTFITLLQEADIPDSFHPGLTKEQVIDLLNSVQIGISSNGIPVISFDPHPLFNNYPSQPRNWRSIEAPSVDQIRAFVEFLKPYIEGDERYDISEEIPTSNSIVDYRRDMLIEGLALSDEMRGLDVDQLYEQNRTFALNLLNDENFPPEWSRALWDLLDKSRRGPRGENSVLGILLQSIINPFEVDIHDGAEHLSTGRGFDRHGEWAALITGMEQSLEYLDDVESLNDVRSFNLEYFRNFGGSIILAQQINAEEDRLISERNKLDKNDDESLKKIKELDKKLDDLRTLKGKLNNFLHYSEAGAVVLALEDRDINSPMDILDPMDESGNFINGSKSTTARYININDTNTELFNATAEEQFNSTMHGSKSRTDSYSIAARELDDIFTDLEMSQQERIVAREALRNGLDKLRSLRELLADEDVPPFMHPGMTREEALAFIDSIKLSVSSNGVPVITFDRLPFVKSILGDIDPIGDDRNWKTVEALDIAQINKFIQAVLSSPEVDPERTEVLNDAEFQAPIVRNDLTLEAGREARQAAADQLNISHPDIIGISFPGIIISQDGYIREKLGITRSRFTSRGSNDLLTELIHHLLDLSSGFDLVHDTMEHFGQGRGFDRHGEWVAFLAGILHTDAWIRREAEEIGEVSSAELDTIRKRLIREYLDVQGSTQLERQIETNKIQEIIKFAKENYDDDNRSERITEAVNNLLKVYVDAFNAIRQQISPQSEKLSFEELSKGEIRFPGSFAWENLVKRIISSIDNWEASNLDNLPAGAIVEFLNFLAENPQKLRERIRGIEQDDLVEELFSVIFGKYGGSGFMDVAELVMPGFAPQTDVNRRLLDEAIDRVRRTSLTADEIIQLLDPRDENGKPINGSKSSTKNAVPITTISDNDIDSIVEEMPEHHISGSKSRTDRYPIVAKTHDGNDRTLESIAADLELTPEELDIAKEAVLASIEDVQDIVENINDFDFDIISREQAIDLLKALTISVSSDGIPMIIGKPHPIISRLIPADIDWANVELPSVDGIRKILNYLQRIEETYMRTPHSERYDIPNPVRALFNRRGIGSPDYVTPKDVVHNSLSDIVISEMQKIYGGNDPWSGLNFRDLEYDSGSWLDTYIAGLKRLVLFQVGNFDDYLDAMSGNQEIDVHDFFGHYGIGRAFDRHGEWANALAIDSVIGSNFTPGTILHDSLTGDERGLNLIRLMELSGLGFNHMYRKLIDLSYAEDNNESENIKTLLQDYRDIIDHINKYPLRFIDVDMDELLRIIIDDNDGRLRKKKEADDRDNINISEAEDIDEITLAEVADDFIRHDLRSNGINDDDVSEISGSKSSTSPGEYNMLKEMYKEQRKRVGQDSILDDTKWKGKLLTSSEIEDELNSDYPDFSGAILDINGYALFDFSGRPTFRKRINFDGAFIGPDVRFVNMDISGSVFDRAHLSSPFFKNVQMSDTSFKNAYGAVRTSNANLQGAIFTGFRNISHDDGDSHSIFVDSNLADTRFDDADLFMTIKRPASITNAYFVNSRLRYLDIDGRSIEKDLAELSGEKPDEPAFLNFSDTKLGVVNIRSVNISGSSFKRAITMYEESENLRTGDGSALDTLVELSRNPSSFNITVNKMVDVDFSESRLTFPRRGQSEIFAVNAALINFDNAVLARMDINFRDGSISYDDFADFYGDYVKGSDKELFFRAMGPSSIGISLDGTQLYNVGIGDQEVGVPTGAFMDMLIEMGLLGENETIEPGRSKLMNVFITNSTSFISEPETVQNVLDIDIDDLDGMPAPIVNAQFASEDFVSPRGKRLREELERHGATFVSGSKSTTSSGGKEPGVWSPPEDPEFFNKIANDSFIKLANTDIIARQYDRAERYYPKNIFDDPFLLMQSMDAWLNPPSVENRFSETSKDLLFEREKLAIAFQSFISTLFESLVEDEEFGPMVNILTNYLTQKHGKVEAFKIIKKASTRGEFAKSLAWQFMTDVAVEMFSMRSGNRISSSDLQNLRLQIGNYLSKAGVVDRQIPWIKPEGFRQVRKDQFRFQEVAKSILAVTEFEKNRARRPHIDEKLKVEIDDLLPDIKRLDASMAQDIKRERKIIELTKDFSDGEVALDAVIEAGSRILERIKLEIERRTSETADKEFALLREVSDAKDKLLDERREKEDELLELGKEALLPTLIDIKGKLLKKNDPNRKNLDDAALRIMDDIIKVVDSASKHKWQKSFITSEIESIDIAPDGTVKESNEKVGNQELMYKLLQALVPGLSDAYPGDRGSFKFLGERAERGYNYEKENDAFEAALINAISNTVNISELMHLSWLLERRGGHADVMYPRELGKPENDQLYKLIEFWNHAIARQDRDHMKEFKQIYPPSVQGSLEYIADPDLDKMFKEALKDFELEVGEVEKVDGTYKTITSEVIDEILERIDKSFGLGIGIENLRKLKDSKQWKVVHDAIIEKYGQVIPHNRNTPKKLINRLNSIPEEIRKIEEEIDVLNKGNLDERELIPTAIADGKFVDQSEIDSSKKDLDSVLSVLKQALPPKIFEMIKQSITASKKSDGQGYRSPIGNRPGRSYAGALEVFTDNKYVDYILRHQYANGTFDDSWPDVRPSGVSESLNDLRDAAAKALDESGLSFIVDPHMARMLTRREIDILRAQHLAESIKKQEKRIQYETLIDILGSTRDGFGYSPNSFQGYISNIHGREGHRHNDVRLWLESLRTMMPQEWIDSLLKRKQDMKWLKRGYFSDGERMLALDGRGKTVLVHEIGHAIERAFPELVGFEALLYRYIAKKRGLSDDTVKKIKLPGDKQKAWPLGLMPGRDELASHYAAKEYADHRAWELFTMILQGLLADKDLLSAYDEDYVKWFLGVMATL